MKYRSTPILPYANYCYSIMPPNLPARFYPEEEDRVHKTENYVICFDEGVSEEMKARIIKDYAKYYDDTIAERGYFYNN